MKWFPVVSLSSASNAGRVSNSSRNTEMTVRGTDACTHLARYVRCRTLRKLCWNGGPLLGNSGIHQDCSTVIRIFSSPSFVSDTEIWDLSVTLEELAWFHPVDRFLRRHYLTNPCQ